MSLTPIHLGKAKGGKFLPDDPDHFKFDFEGLEGLDIKVVISPIRRTRSLELNAFYWSRIVRPLVEFFNREKTFQKVVSGEYVHEILKFKYLGTERVMIPGGEVIDKINSSRTLSNSEFKDFCQYSMDWANSMFNLNIDWPPEKEQAA